LYILFLVSTIKANSHNQITDLIQLKEQVGKNIGKAIAQPGSRQSQLLTSNREQTNSAMKNSEGTSNINSNMSGINGCHRNYRKILNKTSIENYKVSTRVLSPDLNLDYIENKKEEPKKSLNLFETVTMKKRERIRESIKSKLMNYASISITKENKHIRKEAISELSRYNKYNLHSPKNCISVINTCFRQRKDQSRRKNRQNKPRNISPCSIINNHGTKIIDSFLNSTIRRPASKAAGKINENNNTFFNSLTGITNDKSEQTKKVAVRPSSRANKIVLQGK